MFDHLREKLDKTAYGPFHSTRCRLGKKQAYTVNAIVRVIQRAARLAELKIHITAHSLRTSVFTDLEDSGFSIDFLRKLGRWREEKSHMPHHYNQKNKLLKLTLND